METTTPLKVRRKPTTPGVILREHYLVPRNITQRVFADDIGISSKHLSRLINGHVRLEPELAAKLAKTLGTSTQFWLNLQTKVDAWNGNQFAEGWTPKAYHFGEEEVVVQTL